MPPSRPGERIIGIETEFGCLVEGDQFASSEAAVEAIKDHVFYRQELGALDQFARDEVFEPAQSGGFLINGGRLYIDAVGSHLEYATAETRDIKTLIAHDRAGHRLITRAIRELEATKSISVYNNSVDHFGGHTFGCHENYLVQMGEDFYTDQVPRLLAFLITRQVFAGAGRVGGHALVPARGEELPRSNPIDTIWVSNAYLVAPDPTVSFQLSQRADHILKTVASRVRFNRSMINPKWESFYDYEGRHRLHMLFGESNMMEFAFALKVGTTSLVLQALEDNLLEDAPIISGPLYALRDISRDPSMKWECSLIGGESSTALEIQNFYLERCQVFRGQSEQTDWILEQWATTLDLLGADPMKLCDRLDWVAKKKIVGEYIASEGLEPDDDALHSIDLEYHNVDEDRGLFYALQQMGETFRFVDDLDVTIAMTDPPKNTRALARAEIVRRIIDSKSRRYAVDWDAVNIGGHEIYDLDDPFDPTTPTPTTHR
ncbi:MAG: proteasome accessory factor PafA2 family protein [Chthonomonas sp.]|nr:proteasome accessory factor PafA2 family protein [Chthonomonas sp.]